MKKTSAAYNRTRCFICGKTELLGPHLCFDHELPPDLPPEAEAVFRAECWNDHLSSDGTLSVPDGGRRLTVRDAMCAVGLTKARLLQAARDRADEERGLRMRGVPF